MKVVPFSSVGELIELFDEVADAGELLVAVIGLLDTDSLLAEF